MPPIKQEFDPSKDSGLNDPDVKFKICIPNVKRVPLESFLKLFVIGHRTVEAFSLRQTGYTGLNECPEFVVFNEFRKFITVRVHMRSRTYNTHLAEENVEELRSFIYII